MKKKVFAAIVTILIVFLCTSNVSYAMEDIEAEITYEKGVTKLAVSRVNANYKKIPQNIRNRFENEDWKIIIPEESLEKKFNKNIIGRIYFKEKIIYIEENEWFEDAIIHEIGHYIDYSNNFISDSDKFKKIYESEVDYFRLINPLTSSKSTETTMEYFAEFYSYATLFPELAKMTCPETYEFVMKYANAVD